MRILVIKTSALGDIVHTFPAVQMIAQAFPAAEIDWVVEKGCASLIHAHPLISKVHVIETKKWKKSLFCSFGAIKQAISGIRKHSYDAIFDFQGNAKSGIIMGLSRGKTKIGFDKKAVAEFPNLLFSNRKIKPEPGLNIREDYMALVEAWTGQKGKIQNTLLSLNQIEENALRLLIEKKPAGENTLICPGSNWQNKRLKETFWEHFIEKQEGKIWILQNTVEEKQFAEALIGKLMNAEMLPVLTLPLLQHFMRGMNLVASVDSLPLHLAAEAGVPTFSAFGPSLADKYRPLGKLHTSIQGTCPYGKTFPKRCPILRKCKTGACIKNLDLHK